MAEITPEFRDAVLSASIPHELTAGGVTRLVYDVAGIPGALVATLGCVFPSCVIVLILAFVYYRFRGLHVVQGMLTGLRPAVIAMIASAGLSLLLMALYGENAFPKDPLSADWIAALIFAAGFFCLRKWKTNPLLIMACSGAAGVLLYSLHI